jgi:hypothetical protein
MRPHGRVHISRSKPKAQAVCDRCGARYNHSDLSWQFQWQGPRLQNLRILVCRGCLDVPQENIRTIVIPPDPVPIQNPRPELFVSDDNPISGVGWDAANMFRLSGLSSQSTTFGTMIGGGGPDAVFFGGTTKLFQQSATLTPSSTAVGGNSIGKNWSALPGAPAAAPTGFGPVAQSYTISQAVVTAPTNTTFLGTNIPTTIELDGSSNGIAWTVLASAVSLGVPGETVTLNSAVTTLYGYHRILVVGDGTHAAAIASVALYTTGPSGAQTGSELGA